MPGNASSFRWPTVRLDRSRVAQSKINQTGSMSADTTTRGDKGSIGETQKWVQKFKVAPPIQAGGSFHIDIRDHRSQIHRLGLLLNGQVAQKDLLSGCVRVHST